MTETLTFTHYLRVEGVNLSRFIYDSDDLSTIRGGGLLLLDAVQKVHAELEKLIGAGNLTVISEGASAGLFGLTLSPDKGPEGVRQAVARALQTDAKLRHATFVVDVQAAHGEAKFRRDAEELLARNRWRQMQSASVAIPELPDEVPAPVPACEYDGVRPASKGLRGRNRDDGSPTYVSPATSVRREHGRKQKQQFYEERTKVPGRPPLRFEHRFAYEFEQIATRRDQGPLNQKIAVFYADGNGFGKIQRESCRTPTEQRRWDECIRGRRQHLLRDLLEQEVMREPGWLYDLESGECRYRFETLLWGGDEMLFVLPAWQGWRFAQRFFQETEGWDAADAGLAKRPLTHTAALVFCQYHAPIHRIKALAKDQLTEFAKGKDRARNQLVYQVLESFDHLGTDLEIAWRKRVPPNVDLARLILRDANGVFLANQIERLSSGIGELRRQDFSRGQLRQRVTELARGVGLDRPFDEQAERLTRRSQPGARGALEGLSQALGSDWAFWWHLEELWDYAAPRKEVSE